MEMSACHASSPAFAADLRGGFVSVWCVPLCPASNQAVFGSSPRSPAGTSAPPAGAGPTPSPAPSAGAACWRTRTGM